MKRILPVLGILAVGLSLLLGSEGCQTNRYKQGAILYTNFCASCHMEDGTGLEGVIPPLAGTDYVAQNPAQVACVIRYGLSDTIVVNERLYNQPMAAIPKLSEFEITNVINYINQAWGNDYGYVTLQKVQEALRECAPAEK